MTFMRDVNTRPSSSADFKIQRRDARQRERRLKSEFAFFQFLQRLFLPSYYVKCRRTVLRSPEAEFQVTISKLRKRNKISSMLVYIPHKTRNQAFSRRSRAKTGKKCTKKRDARANLLFCLLNLLGFFDVLVAVRVVGS